MIQQMLAIWSLVPLPFLNPICTSGSSQLTYCEGLPCYHVKWAQLSGSLNILWHWPSLGLEWKLTFYSPVSTAEFSQFVAYWVQHFHSIIWNSSAGILSAPLALFVVMPHKARLTLNSRMSGSRWMITPSLLFGTWKSFLYSTVYSCHLFLIYFASFRYIPFLSFILPIFTWSVPLVSLIFF